MPIDEDRESRWFACLLGDVTEEERLEIEAEMEDAPEEAAHVRQLFEAVSGWAHEPVPHTPVDFSQFPQPADYAVPDPAPASPIRRLARVPLQPWFWAAAALFLLALTQVQFTISFGDATLAWGQPLELPQTDEAATGELEERLAIIEDWALDSDEFLQAVALCTMDIEEGLEFATTELARTQRIEAQTRYNESQRLWQLIRQSGPVDVGWQ